MNTVAEATSLTTRIQTALACTDYAITPPLPALQNGDICLGLLPLKLRHLYLCIEKIRSEAANGMLQEEHNKTPEELILEYEDLFDRLLLVHFSSARHSESLQLRVNWLVVSSPRQ